ncbi:hypothetical protein ADUPG1_014066, partial [Aduncisulcus paluster]
MSTDFFIDSIQKNDNDPLCVANRRLESLVY